MKRAVILHSGGMDPATVLAIAREAGNACHALSLHYGQRHNAELAAAGRVAKSLGAVEHRVLRLALSDFGGSAFTDDAIAVPESPTEGIPATYVTARNAVMLALALSWTGVLGSRDTLSASMPTIIRGIPIAVRSSSKPPGGYSGTCGRPARSLGGWHLRKS